jgi:hypothetical protein
MKGLDFTGILIYVGLAGVVVSLVVLLAVATLSSVIFGA